MRKVILAAMAAFSVSIGVALSFPQYMLINGGMQRSTAFLSASPTSVNSGSSSVLTWGSTNAASCVSPGSLGNTAIPSFTGAKSGSLSTGALTSSTSYSIQCGTATASATVTVTGGGGSIACAIGPPYQGSVPAPAQAAGFTTCAANYDFTSSAPFSFGGHAYNFSNVSSWFACVNGLTTTNANPLWAQNSGTVSGGNEANCSDITIGADPANPSGVPQVLGLTVTPSDTNALSIGTDRIVGATASTICESSDGSRFGGCFGLFPTLNMYVETVYRLDTAAINSFATFGGGVGLDSWSLPELPFNTGNEVDFIEWFGTTVAKWGLNPHSGGVINNATYDSNYHTLGLLVTSNNAGNVESACPYWDGVAGNTSCVPSTSGGNALQLGELILWNYYNSPSPGVFNTTGNIPEYIKAVRIWSCPGWNNTNPPTFNANSSSSCITANPYSTPP